MLSLEFSTKIPLLGQRKKVALAVREAKEKQRKSNNTAVGDKPKTFFVSRTKNLCPQQMLRARANGETFVSATMCPRLPGPEGVYGSRKKITHRNFGLGLLISSNYLVTGSKVLTGKSQTLSY